MRRYSILAVVLATAISVALFATQASAAKPTPETPPAVAKPFQVVLTGTLPVGTVTEVTTNSYLVPSGEKFILEYVHGTSVNASNFTLFLDFGPISIAMGNSGGAGTTVNSETVEQRINSTQLVFESGESISGRFVRFNGLGEPEAPVTLVLSGQLIMN